MRTGTWFPLALLIATPAFARQPESEVIHTKHVVLQVEQEPNYEANNLVMLLSMNAYVGAISPRLAVTETLVPGKVGIWAKLGSPELMTLSFVGVDRAELDVSSKAVVEHLTSLVPTRRRTMHESLARAEHELAEVKAKRDAAQAAFAKFRDVNGGDVGIRLSDVQVLLRSQRSELAQMSDRLAVSVATRDFLREAIRTEQSWNDETAAALRDEYDKLKAALAKVRETRSEQHPEVEQLKDKLARLEPSVVGGGSGQPLQVLEQRLFVTEEEVFAQERRREWLSEQIKANDAAERELAKTRDSWELLEQAFHAAERQVMDARAMLDQLTREYSRLPQGEWIRVVAGAG
jgi:hypothetical protein